MSPSPCTSLRSRLVFTVYRQPNWAVWNRPTLLLRTSRLDLDDYNKEVEEGLHITSMAGTWLSIVEGFGGMRLLDDKLHFQPQIPEQWTSFSFKVNFRNRILTVRISHEGCSFFLEGQEEMSIRVNGERLVLPPGQEVKA